MDSEELAGRLQSDGWELVDASEQADVLMVNTCGFIEQAKKDSIDALLAARDSTSANKVVAVGCLAQRYGKDLAEQMPELDAVLSFDHYPVIGQTLHEVLEGKQVQAHTPQDRRTLLPLTPIDRVEIAQEVAIPGMGPHLYRARLNEQPWAPLKIASGCDRRCTFCAIPAFRGSFVSRDPLAVIQEAAWLGSRGVRELLLVSENSTSYGKDLGDLRSLEKLLPALAILDGIERVRVSYLQPAEMRPDLIQIIAQTPGVSPYFDLSFQHASPMVLRRMKRFGGMDEFLQLLETARGFNPNLGARSNFIVGFPGETEDDLQTLAEFIDQARLDAVGVFAYSDEDGTAACNLDGHLSAEEVNARFDHIAQLANRVCEDVAMDRIGQEVTILIEDDGNVGRADHQGPEVDGITTVLSEQALSIGTIVHAQIVQTEGIDLIAQVVTDGGS